MIFRKYNYFQLYWLLLFKKKETKKADFSSAFFYT
jgi:hypothetical protein